MLITYDNNYEPETPLIGRLAYLVYVGTNCSIILDRSISITHRYIPALVLTWKAETKLYTSHGSQQAKHFGLAMTQNSEAHSRKLYLFYYYLCSRYLLELELGQSICNFLPASYYELKFCDG